MASVIGPNFDVRRPATYSSPNLLNWDAAAGRLVDAGVAKTDIDAKATTAALSSHTGNTSNPHTVTAAQVGAYTTAQADTLLAGKAASSHTHTLSSVTDAGTAAGYDVGTTEGTVLLLGADGKVPTDRLPAIAIGERFTANSEAAMLALAAQIGDICIRIDQSNAKYLLTGTAGTLADWVSLEDVAGGVSSWNSLTGAVSATTDNLPEGATKLYFTDARAQTALAGHTGSTSNPHSVTADQVGAYTDDEVDALLGGKAGLADANTFSQINAFSSGLTIGGAVLLKVTAGALDARNAADTVRVPIWMSNAYIASTTLTVTTNACTPTMGFGVNQVSHNAGLTINYPNSPLNGRTIVLEIRNTHASNTMPVTWASGYVLAAVVGSSLSSLTVGKSMLVKLFCTTLSGSERVIVTMMGTEV